MTYSLSPSNAWSTTDNSTDGSHLRSLSYPTPIPEPDQGQQSDQILFSASSSLALAQTQAPDFQLMTNQTKVKAEYTGPKGPVLNLKLTSI